MRQTLEEKLLGSVREVYAHGGCTREEMEQAIEITLNRTFPIHDELYHVFRFAVDLSGHVLLPMR